MYVCTGRVIYYWIIVTRAAFKSIRTSGRSDLNHIGPYSIKLNPLFFANIGYVVSVREQTNLKPRDLIRIDHTHSIVLFYQDGKGGLCLFNISLMHNDKKRIRSN